jgi:hypothetical protein
MRVPNFFLMCATGALLVGCAGYRLGSVNPDAAVGGGKSVEVLPFNNQTRQPRLGDAVTQALREQLQADGTYHLATRGSGDVVITGVITSYQREGLSYLNTDVVTVENYRVGIVAHIMARDRATGRLLFDKRDVKGYTLVHVGTDLADAERQSLPLLAEDLARNTVELLTEGAW